MSPNDVSGNPAPSVSYRRDGRIGLITVNNPPVNALSQPVRAGLMAALDQAQADAAADLFVITCLGRTFMAGADIGEFGGEIPGPQLPDIADRIEAFERPVLAAMHGTTLGGGLEVALACHYRVADPRTRMGLPEVKLGIIPGAGGTQRLPRLVGVPAAVEMIESGRPIDARRALEIGLVDRIAEGELTAATLAYAQELLTQKAPPRRTGALESSRRDLSADYFDRRRAELKRARHPQPNALAIVDAIEAACTLPLAEGLRRENELFIECYKTPQAAALWHVFFAERAAGAVPGLEACTPPLPLAQAAVIGAGTMGSGIAICLADAGIPVALFDSSAQALERGRALIESTYRAAQQKGRIDERTMQQRVALIRTVRDYTDLAQADLVIEAVFEGMDVKREVFRELDRVCKAGAILATNTSTLDVDAIAAATTRPQQVLGLHFFSPANVMRLLEIVRGARTSDSVLQSALKLAPRLNKLGVVSGVCFGFIANRSLDGYLREAGMLLLEGASPRRIDEVITNFGFPMGPFAMQDLAGIDVGWRVRQERKLPARAEPYYCVADRLYERGRHGQKTGAGWYRYDGGDRRGTPDPEVDAIVEAEARRLGIERAAPSADEIIERLLLPVINEGARILEEGIALRPGDIDLAWINGFGFPAWRGGPMYYADRLGVDVVVGRLRHYASRYGVDWQPARLLVELAAAGRPLASFKAGGSDACEKQ